MVKGEKKTGNHNTMKDEERKEAKTQEEVNTWTFETARRKETKEVGELKRINKRIKDNSISILVLGPDGCKSTDLHLHIGPVLLSTN